MKILFFIFLFIFSLSANPLLVLEKKVNNLALSLNKQNNQYFLKVDWNSTNKIKNIFSSHYYLVSFDDLLQVRKINQYKIDNHNQEKMTLEIAFFHDEKIQYLKETTLDNLRQEREFNEQGYLLKDTIFFPQGGNKSKKYHYDSLGNLTAIEYYEDQLFISEKKITIINDEEKRIDFFNRKKELIQYQIEKSKSENDYEKTITTYSPLGKKIFSQKQYYTNSLLSKVIIEDQKEIDYFYNEKNQLITKSIKALNFNHQQKFHYFYSSNPVKSYLLFNPYFRVNSLINRKDYWEEELKEENLSLKNHYQDLVAFSRLEKENNQTRKINYQFLTKTILAHHYENDKIIQKKIYDNYGNQKSEDNYTYYINSFLASREFSSRDFIRKRKVTFFYEELPLNKNGYERCKNSNQQAEIMDFNFANILFQELYLLTQNSPKKKVSFQKDFLDFQDRLLENQSSHKKLLEKLSFIEICKMNKMIISDQNDKITSYLRIIFKKQQQQNQVTFNYYQEPSFNYSEKYDVRFYQKNYPSLIEKTTQEKRRLFFDEKQGFLNKANDQISSYKERIHNQFIFYYHHSNALIFAQKNCYNSSGEKIGSVFIYPKTVILDKNKRCNFTYSTKN